MEIPGVLDCNCRCVRISVIIPDWGQVISRNQLRQTANQNEPQPMDFRTRPDSQNDLSLFAGDDRRPPSFELRPTVAQPSAAWLMAQRAFAMPEHVPAQQAQPVLVVVRKGRGLLRSGTACAMSTQERGDASLPAAKSPRVFRLGQSAGDAPRDAQANAADAAGIAAAATPATPVVAAQPSGRRSFRRHRFDDDKKPGPVLQVFQAPVAEGIVIDTPRVDAGLSPSESSSLTTMLADVHRSIDDSLAAEAFEFAPASTNWREFLGAIDRMRGQLQQLKTL